MLSLLVLWIPLVFSIISFSFMSVKIEYGEDGFIYTNVFGVKKNFCYTDVIEIIDKGGNVRVITERKNILLLNVLSGVRYFTSYVKVKNPNVKI